MIRVKTKTQSISLVMTIPKAKRVQRAIRVHRSRTRKESLKTLRNLINHLLLIQTRKQVKATNRPNKKRICPTESGLGSNS